MSSQTDNRIAARAGHAQSTGSSLEIFRQVSVETGYAKWAQTYDSTPNPLLSLEERIMDFLLPDLHNKFVMDVACGTGRWLLKLKNRGAARGVGIDLSAEMLAQASRKPGLNGHLARGEVCALPFRSGVADLLISSFAVGYIADLQAFARELARVARQDGIVIVTDLHPSNYSRRWRRTFRLGSEVVEIQSYSRSLAVLCSQLETCGLNLEAYLEPSFGEPERLIFDLCGKGQLFEEARNGPAIFVCVFKRATAIIGRGC